MNPRGRQYALGGTLSGWTRLQVPDRRQRRALRLSYRGLNPLVYSRFGYRQWAAALPNFRLVVKDPFAMLSIPLVREVTGARVVLVFRHPGAALASYRRMGWTPDLEELRPIVARFLQHEGEVPGVRPLYRDDRENPVAEMAWFWNVLYGIAAHETKEISSLVTLAHHDIATGGENFCRSLVGHLDLRWDAQVGQQLLGPGSDVSAVNETALHNFGRPAAQVAHEWEKRVAVEERRLLEKRTAELQALLGARAFRPLPGSS